MNKELELEAVKYKDLNLPDDLYDAYIAGATSKWVEKQKLEFAIEQLNKFSDTYSWYEAIQELEQKLNEL